MWENGIDIYSVRVIRTRTNLYFGVGAIQYFADIADQLTARGITSVLVVTGRSSYKRTGAWEVVEKILNSRKISYALYDRVTPNPTTVQADEATALGKGIRAQAVIAIGGDLATSVVATLNLKELGVQTVVCKATDETQRRALEKIGADRVVVPERESGIKLAQSLTSSSILDFIELSPDCGIAELQTPPEWCGKSIRELDIRAKYGVNVIAVRENGKVHVTLDANRPLDDKLTLVLLGENDRLARVKP